MKTIILYSIPAMLILYLEISKRHYIKKTLSSHNQFENFNIKSFKRKILLSQLTIFLFALVHLYFFSNYMEKINLNIRPHANTLYNALFVLFISFGRVSVKDFFIRDNILYYPFGVAIELNNDISYVKLKRYKTYTSIKLSYHNLYSKGKKKNLKLYIYNKSFELFDLNNFN